MSILLPLLLLTNPSDAPADAALGRLVVYVDAEGFDARQRDIVERVLLRKLASIEGIDASAVANPMQVRDECPDAKTACLSKLIGALGTPYILTARVVHLDDTDTLTLRLFDLERVEALGSAMRAVSGGGSVLRVVDNTVAEVFPARPASWNTPLLIDARMHPDPVSPWIFGGAAAATVGAGATWLAFALRANGAERDFNAYVSKNDGEPLDGRKLANLETKAEDAAFRANMALLSTGVLAVTTVVLGFLTDFAGDDAMNAELSTSAPR